MKTRYYVEPRGALTVLSAAFMGISFLLRLLWCILWPEEVTGSVFYFQALTPLLSAVIYLFVIFKYGKTRLYLTFIPVFLGVLFFIIKAAGFLWWHQLLCTILYFFVAALYGLAVFGVLPIRKLLIPLFGLPLLFHIFIEDLIINIDVYTPSQWVQESSVIMIMAALLCVSLAMREKGKMEE